jgi:uncharacterized protein (DUF1684 family)
MMKAVNVAILLSLIGFGLLAGPSFAADAGSSNYEREVAKFRHEREQQLKAEDGWLTVVGLHWLKEGANRIGSDPASEVPLPAAAPKRVGSILYKGGKAHFRPAPGIALKEADLKEDTDILTVGRIKFFVIKREDKLAVRVKDNVSAARKEFTSLEWFPADTSWKIRGRFTPWKEKHTITFDTIAGVKEQDESPGYVTFVRNGQEYKLEPVVDEGQFFFVFRDQTSGKSTYPAARFLYTDRPTNGYVWLDFNKAVNPPCVFTPYATCPLPPPQNRLALAVLAGEKMYGKSSH